MSAPDSSSPSSPENSHATPGNPGATAADRLANLEEVCSRIGQMDAAEGFALLCQDQRTRWLRRQPVAIEEYCRHLPSLAANAEALLDLIYNEILVREELGERPDWEEYRRRFPNFRDELARLASVDRWVQREIPQGDVAGFLSQGGPASAAHPTAALTPSEINHNLLAGLLAVLHNYIDAAQLKTALESWLASGRTQPLVDLLWSAQLLSDQQRTQLQERLAEHLRVHENDLGRALSALSIDSAIRSVLEEITDPELRESLASVGSSATPEDFERAPTRPPEGGPQPGSLPRLPGRSRFHDGRVPRPQPDAAGRHAGQRSPPGCPAARG
jgi:hypothetical protein